jgi:hypothetical protein
MTPQERMKLPIELVFHEGLCDVTILLAEDSPVYHHLNGPPERMEL